MNCLILGGAGFIGSHIVDALVNRGHRARAFDRFNVDTSNLTDALIYMELFRGDFLNESDISCALQDIDFFSFYENESTPLEIINHLYANDFILNWLYLPARE